MSSLTQLIVVSTENNAVPMVRFEKLAGSDTFVTFDVKGDFKLKDSLIPMIATKPENIPLRKRLPVPCVIC